ncbi:MAG: endonuclease-8 [Myxococcota bacterium]
MPEGDTIHIVARTLRPTAVGCEVTELVLHGQVVDIDATWLQSVEAHGKHLVFKLGHTMQDETPGVLRVHLGMKGSWHRYRPGERWGRSMSTARVILRTEPWDYVCFNTRDAVLYPSVKEAHRAVLGQLGPDLLAQTFDARTAVARARTLPRHDADISTLLLHQGVACGIGNIYRLEVLFLHQTNPWRAAADVDDSLLAAIYASARTLMQTNLASGTMRTTTGAAFQGRPGGVPTHLRHYVFRRAQRPCLRCQTPIKANVHQQTARHTFWCPSCQAT